jgi:hypothetical protein
MDPRRGVVTILEFKYQHTSDAWHQLTRLYLPVLSQLFPRKLWRFALCEVVKWYDPATVFPCPVTLAKDPLLLRPGQFGVHIWSP